MSSLTEQVRRQLEDSARVNQSFSPRLIGDIAAFAEKAAAALGGGGKMVFFGNGGSASDAIHLSAELVVRLQADRPSFARIGLFPLGSLVTNINRCSAGQSAQYLAVERAC